MVKLLKKYWYLFVLLAFPVLFYIIVMQWAKKLIKMNEKEFPNIKNIGFSDSWKLMQYKRNGNHIGTDAILKNYK